MSLCVCSLHTKYYVWPVRSERTYRMPSSNLSRNSDSEETIIWKLSDMKQIKGKCFFRGNRICFSHYMCQLSRKKRWILVPIKGNSQADWTLFLYPSISLLQPTELWVHKQQKKSSSQNCGCSERLNHSFENRKVLSLYAYQSFLAFRVQ